MLSNEILNAFSLAIRADGTYTPFSADALKYALEMTLMGMGMIFAVLAILWGVLAIFKFVFAGKSEKPKKDKAEKAVNTDSPAPAAAPAPEPAPVTASASNDAELIAILTAAIMAYEAEQNPNAPVGNFRVVSYRRANGGRSWNAK